jgi:hypothetical protein
MLLADLEKAAAPNGTVEDINVSIEEAYHRGEKDISFFAALAMPSVCIFSLPEFYVAMWMIVTSREEDMEGMLMRFALGLPRGHAKTTFIKVLICWLIVYDRISFALILCSNSELAEALLADINDILISDNMTAIYGDWGAGLAIDSADQKKASYHSRPVVLVARGWAAGVRGLNLKNQRPDLIFCDDVQTRKNDESPTERNTLLKELVGTIFKAIAPRGNRLIIYVGNMYSEECILNQLKKNTKWISMITGALLSNGEPLWPALFSREELMESYEHDEQLGMAHIWFAEVMNDPKSVAVSLLPLPIPDSPHLNIEECDGSFITIDPANFKKTSDDNVIAVHHRLDQKIAHGEVVVGIIDPLEVVKTALRLALQYNCSLIGVEDAGYQSTLAFWISHFMTEGGIENIMVVPLKHHGRSKESRIRTHIQELYAGSCIMHNPDLRRRYIWQASLYKLGISDNRDDLLDGEAYSIDVRKEYWHFVVNHAKVNVIEGEATVVGENTPF